MKTANILDPEVPYSTLEKENAFSSFMDIIREGIQFKVFKIFAKTSPFTLTEWSSFLHLSERTLQCYDKEKRKFDALQSEKILEIVLLYKKGTEVFGTAEKFNSWLETDNLALGRVKPKSFLDSSFGINLLKDELTRVEYGILA